LEEERRRIARELHDSTAQHLTAVGLQLSCLLRTGGGLGLNDFVEDARESLLEAQREIRTLSYLLHPPVTGAESLVSAARRFIEGFELRTGLNATLRHVDDPLPPLSADRGAALFRVLQEALANVARHSHADTAWVTLKTEDSHIELMIEDNGIGYDTERITKGIGLDSMRERVNAVNGRLEISRRSPQGTCVTARVRRS
jgi:signal transduction histidine kinase